MKVQLFIVTSCILFYVSISFYSLRTRLKLVYVIFSCENRIDKCIFYISMRKVWEIIKRRSEEINMINKNDFIKRCKNCRTKWRIKNKNSSKYSIYQNNVFQDSCQDKQIAAKFYKIINKMRNNIKSFS